LVCRLGKWFAVCTDLGDQLERETGLTAESIKETQAKLLTFSQIAKTADEAGGAFDRATKAAIDMGAAGFGEATTNAVQLGQGFTGPH
jgi:phage-related minor tail protein